MKLKFTKEQTEKIIKSYYKMYYGKDVEIEIKVSKGYEGLYETPCTNVRIVVISEVEVLGESVETKIELNKIEVTDIIKEVLSEEKYEVESISYDAGVSSGDYFDRGTPTSYFCGIDVEVKQPIKQKTKAI